MQYHPDRNKSPLAHGIMVNINAAYEVLSDNKKKQQYHDLCSDEANGKYHNYSYSNRYSNDEANNQSNQNEEYASERVSDVFNSGERRDKVSIWWQMLFAVIPFVNCWAFYRIERTFMSVSVLTPLLVGTIVLIFMIPSLNDMYKPYLFLLLFGIALVVLIRKWSVEWNIHIHAPGYGDTADQVSILWQMLFAVIPFVNIAAFARVEKLCMSTLLALPTYFVMSIPANMITSSIPNYYHVLYFPIYFALTSPILLFYMCKWTIKWNSGEGKSFE
jgi:hypothetical protein